MPIQADLKNGSQDPYVVTAQKALIALGYALPRFGADGVLGDETLSAYGSFLIADGLPHPGSERPNAITPDGARALEKAYAALKVPPTDGPDEAYIDERSKHRHSGRSVAVPYRNWSQVTAIVLHQTASQIGEAPASWHPVPIHFGVTRSGKVIQLYDLTEVCNHANGLNQRSVGIEIDGWFSGIEGRPDTLWQPRNRATPRQPMILQSVQADAAKSTVRRIISTVAANGGKITHIHAHRQSSEDRQSDPGSLIWQTVGIWAQKTLGLSDGGAKFTVGNGLVIPKEWDASYPDNRY